MPRYEAGAGPQLTDLELAVNWPFGVTTEPWWPERSPLGPLAALEEILGEALRRPPCVVAFSGGRDSAVILSVAAEVARREGLDLPVAYSMQYPGRPEADERAWQEMLMTSLDLREWERVPMADQFDLLGPEARAGLEEHGFLWSPGCHIAIPMARLARGGTLVTGTGGDEVFGAWPWRSAMAFRHGGSRRTLRGLRRLILMSSPPRARAWWYRRRDPMTVAYLRPAAAQEVTRRFASDTAAAPRDYGSWLRWHVRRRSNVIGIRTTETLAAPFDARVEHPFLNPRFLRALGDHAGPAGFPHRTAAMSSLFGHLLPRAMLERAGKAHVSGAVWGPGAQAFAEAWTGGGVPEAIVDPEALRRSWLQDKGWSDGLALLQTAWLSAAPEVREQVARGGLG